MKRLAALSLAVLVALAAAYGLLRDPEAELATPAPRADREHVEAEAAPLAAETPPAPSREEAAPSATADEPRSEDAPAAEVAETFRVRIVDALAQEPIEGAQVFIRSVEGEWTADEDGWCDTGLAVPAGRRQVKVSAGGYKSVDRWWTLQSELTIELGPLATLCGRVLDAETQRPVAGAELRWWEPDQRVETAADGTFVLGGLDRDVRLGIRAAGHGVQRFRFHLAETDVRIERTFHLWPAETFGGRVVDASSGVPLEDATVYGRSSVLRTDDDGRFELESVPDPGERGIRVVVRPAGHCGAEGPVLPGEEIELPLPRAVALEGTVTTADGEPVAGASVTIDLADRQDDAGPALPAGWFLKPSGYRSSGSTDDAGFYRIEGLVPWSKRLQVELMVEVEMLRETLAIESMPSPGSTTRLDVRLSPPPEPGPTGTVRGTVRVNGEFPELAIVSWRSGEGQGSFMAERRYASTYYFGGISGRVELEVDMLMSWPQEWLHLFEGRTAVVVVGDGEEVTHDFDVRWPETSIRGRVADRQGRTVGGHGVRAALGETVFSSAKADDEGRFEVTVPRDADAVDLHAGWYRDTIVPGIAPGTSDVEVVVDPPGQVRVRALDASTGAVLTDVELHWRKRGAGSFHQWLLTASRTPDVGGWFDLPAPATDLELLVLERLHVPAAATVTVPPDGAAEVDVVMERGLTLELHLADPTRTPPACMLVEPEHHPFIRFDGSPRALPGLPPHVGFTRRKVIWCDGVAHLTGLPPGTYRFLVADGDPMPDPAEIVLRESGQVVEVRWER